MADSPKCDRQADLSLVQGALAGRADQREELGLRLECIPRFVYHRDRQLGSGLSSHEREDIAQDVIAVFWRKLELFNGQAVLETWIFRICTLEMMNFIRKKARRAQRHAEPPKDADGNQTMELLAGSKQQLPPHLQFEELYRGLSELSAGDSAILRRKYYDGQSFDEIGAGLGLTTSVAKHRYYAALRQLKAAMSNSKSSPS